MTNMIEEYKIEFPTKETAVITFSISKEDLEEAMKQAATMTGSDDEKINRQTAVNLIAGATGSEAMEKNNLKLATQPALTYTDNNDGGLLVDVTCTLVPEVTLGKYIGYDIHVEPVEITEEEVDAGVQQRISANQLWDKLPENTPAENGNRVIIDFLGEKDGVPFEGGAGNSYPLVLGSASFIPGFEDQLIGIKAGEEKDVNVTFPENYFEPSLAGAPVVFHVKCLEVEKEVTPVLDNAFIEKMRLEGVKTVEDLKIKVKEDLKELKTQEAERKALDELLAKIIDGSSVEIPAAMSQSMVDQYMAQLEDQMKQFGMGMDQYLEMTGMSQDELRQSMVPQAEGDIKNTLVLEAIAEKEAIQAQQDEIEKEYELLSRVYNQPAEVLKQMVPAASVAFQLTQKKTLDFLKDANIKK